MQNNTSYQARPDWFEAVLPVAAIPLILLLILILPLFLLSAESLFAPVFEFIRSLLIPINAGMSYTSLPLMLIFKILLFSIVSFTGMMLLMLKITCLYHEIWSHFFYQPHPRHVAYQPDQQESMMALFNWNVFRWGRILSRPIGWIVLTVIIGAGWLWIFNSMTDFGFFTFQLQFSLGFFLMMTLFFFTFLSVMKAIWHVFTTSLGDVAAITEPNKPAQVIYDRARKLTFISPWSFLLYPLYFLFYIAVIAEVILLIISYDVNDILSFNPDIMPIYLVELATFMILTLLSAMKFMTYHDALVRYYQKHFS